MKAYRWISAIVIMGLLSLVINGFNEHAAAEEHASPQAAAEQAHQEESPHETQEEFDDPDITGDNLVSDQNVKIVFDKLVHDFGDVAPNSKNNTEFKFTNEGTETLIVKRRIGSTCGCTVPTLDKEEYAPGESGIIKVTYTAAAKPGPDERHLHVYNNSPDRAIMLTIKANTIEKVSFVPARISLVHNVENAGCPDIKITSKDNTEFSITRVTSPNNAITAEFDPEEKNTEFVIKPHVNLERIKQQNQGLVSIHITHPHLSKIDIPYTILPPFRADPATIIALNAKAAEPIKRTVYILGNYDEPFEIESVEAEDGFVKVVKMEKHDNNRQQIDFEITPPEQTTRRHFNSSVTVNIKGGQTLTINVIGSLAMQKS
ncbi:MAG: DUF1573 domain-containing protein [Phycisphaerae bacterium]